MVIRTPAHSHQTAHDQTSPCPSSHLEQLVSWGLSEAQAEEWIQLSLPQSRDMVELALEEQPRGLSPGTFVQWCELGEWSPDGAEAFLRVGFSEPEASFALRLLELAARKRRGNLDALIESWLACPLSPAWICRALAIGITRPGSAQALFARSLVEPRLTRTLDINADYRGANNRDLILDEANLQRLGVQQLEPSHLMALEPGRPAVRKPPHTSVALWAVDDAAEPG